MKPSSYLELPDAADASEQDSQVPLPEGARRVAVIDLGSNSLRLLVSQVGGDGRIQVLNCVKSMVRLCEGGVRKSGAAASRQLSARFRY